MKEMVLYYNPAPAPHVAKLKGVLVRMGVRIKNIGPEQVRQKIGFLAGMPGFTNAEEETLQSESKKDESMIETEGSNLQERLSVTEEVLVMKNFTSRRIDELLTNLKKAGVPKIALKAIITEQNSQWTFYQLCEELKKEHAAMNKPVGQEERKPQEE